MTSFNFDSRTISIKSLELRSEDNPSIEIHNDEVIITATRGDDHIKIKATIPGVNMSVASTSVKTPRGSMIDVKPARASRNTHPLKGRTLPSSDKRTGENNVLAKLTAQQVLEIRELAKDSEIVKSYGSLTSFCVEIGKVYNVHFTTIAAILRRASWKHI